MGGIFGEYTWYELIGMTYNAQGQLNRSTRNQVLKSVVNPSLDSATVEHKDEHAGINHQLSINASPKLGYITISPFISYTEKWYNKSIRRDSLGTYDVKGFQTVRMFSTGVSASTRFFGIVQPQV